MAGDLKLQKVLVAVSAGYLEACVGVSLAANSFDVCLGSGTSFLNGKIDWCKQVYTDLQDSHLSFF